MEHKDRRPLFERQIGEILNRKESAINRVAQLPPTLARHFSEPGAKERMTQVSHFLSFRANEVRVGIFLK